MCVHVNKIVNPILIQLLIMRILNFCCIKIRVNKKDVAINWYEASLPLQLAEPKVKFESEFLERDFSSSFRLLFFSEIIKKIRRVDTSFSSGIP